MSEDIPVWSEPAPRETEIKFSGIEQVDGYAYGVVYIFIGPEDPKLRVFGARLEVPIRDVHAKTVREIEDHCIDLARRSFDPEEIHPALRLAQ